MQKWVHIPLTGKPIASQVRQCVASWNICEHLSCHSASGLLLFSRAYPMGVEQALLTHQGLGSCAFLCLECSYPDIHKTSSPISNLWWNVTFLKILFVTTIYVYKLPHLQNSLFFWKFWHFSSWHLHHLLCYIIYSFILFILFLLSQPLSLLSQNDWSLGRSLLKWK